MQQPLGEIDVIGQNEVAHSNAIQVVVKGSPSDDATDREALLQRLSRLRDAYLEQGSFPDGAARQRLLSWIDDAAEADMLFSVLMGDAVEPRRQFIEEHALDVQNLDI